MTARTRQRVEDSKEQAQMDKRLVHLESNFQRLGMEVMSNSMQIETLSNSATARSKEGSLSQPEWEQIRIELGQWQASMKEMLAHEFQMIRDSISQRGMSNLEHETEVKPSEDVRPMVSGTDPAHNADTDSNESGSPSAQNQQLRLLQEILQRLPRVRQRATEKGAMEQADQSCVDLGLRRFRSDVFTGRRSSVALGPRPQPTRLQQIVSGYSFNILFAALILANAIVIGYKASEDVQRAIDGTAKQVDWYTPVEIIFAVSFSIELILRISAERMAFFVSDEKWWNILDLLIVLLSIGQLFFPAGVSSFGYLRIVRAMRLIRVARIIRVVRFFRDLRIMLESLMVSLVSLFWAFVLMSLTIYIFTVAFLGAAADYLDADTPHDASTEAALKTWFPDLPQAMLTLLMSFTGGQDWWEFADTWWSVGFGYMCLYVLYVMFMSFGMMNILTAFFVDSATRMSAFDSELVIDAKLEQESSTVEGLKKFFSSLDRNSDGRVSLEQFEHMMAKDDVRNHLAHLDIEPSEVGTFFKLLDTTGSGRISIDEFVSGCIRIKGGAREVDLATMLYENKKMSQHWSASMQVLEEVLRDIHACLKESAVWEAPPLPADQTSAVSRLEFTDNIERIVGLGHGQDCEPRVQ